jgi:hypothetical protein
MPGVSDRSLARAAARNNAEWLHDGAPAETWARRAGDPLSESHPTGERKEERGIAVPKGTRLALSFQQRLAANQAFLGSPWGHRKAPFDGDLGRPGAASDPHGDPAGPLRSPNAAVRENV